MPLTEGALLPEAFWGVFDFSIRAPNAPMVWGTGGTESERASEIENATRTATAAAQEWEEEKKKIEEQSGVIIRYCGGCGFAHRASELQEYLDAAVGVRPALLRDNGVTGNFDVSVRVGGGKEENTTSTFQLIHSKKTPVRELSFQQCAPYIVVSRLVLAVGDRQT